MSYDASDPMHVAKRSKSLRGRERILDAALRSCMAGENGRRLFYVLLAECNIYSNPFHPDTAVMAFNCGKIDAGQKLLGRMMRACPELYSKMIEEENVRQSVANTEHDSGQSGARDESDSDAL